MKHSPVLLPPVCAGATIPSQATVGTMDRVPLPLPFNPTELLWRYPMGLPSSPLMDFKTHLPNTLATDPRIWSRDDVTSFLRWCEREFDLQPFDMERFQMNGKAMCLLTRTDLAERCPGAGDVLHNVLQLLVRDASLLQRCLPSSPVTPTSRHAYPLSPHSHPPTPNWNVISQQTADHFQNAAHAANLAAHFMSQSNSVTLSPAPSVDSQSGSPHHVDGALQQAAAMKTEWPYNGSNQSDSDEDSYQEASLMNGQQNGSPPNTPNVLAPPPLKSPKKETQAPLTFRPVAREFFPNDPPEPNTNGRLLWDFLQQLLNDANQRYTNYIAWKNRETGIFKIVDPAGLAKLWGIQKNHLSMNYDKMSRALRYYYRVNILRKVQGERHCYQFLRNPTELKNIKNISLLRQQMSPTQTNAPTNLSIPSHNAVVKSEPLVKHEDHHHHQQQQHDGGATTTTRTTASPTTTSGAVAVSDPRRIVDDDDMPTDLSMSVAHCRPTDLSSKADKHRISVLCAPEINKAREIAS